MCQTNATFGAVSWLNAMTTKMQSTDSKYLFLVLYECFADLLFQTSIFVKTVVLLEVDYFESFLKRNMHCKIWPWGYKTFFMLNSAEHEIFPAHKC